MSIILETAKQFFEACETGKGWDACKAFCNPSATFSSQTNALSEIATLEDYCEWMKNLFTALKQAQAVQYHQQKRQSLRLCIPHGF